MKITDLVYDDYKQYEVKRPACLIGGFNHTFEFPNGYGASVIKKHGSYGLLDDLFELAVLHNGSLCFDTKITDDVIGWLSNDEVIELLEEIKNLEAN